MSKLIDVEPIIKRSEEEGKKLVTVELLKQMPTVEERKRGYWIINHPSNLMPYKCSCCNKDSSVHGNYCPECGSIMDD